MNRLQSAALLISMASLIACSNKGSKKVVIMSTGPVTVDGATIKLGSGTGHAEQTVSFNGDGRVVLNIQTPDGTDSVGLDDNGLYVLNLKLQDTLVGGLVNYGASGTKRVSDEMLPHIIDSTRKLILGMGASDSTHTYFILPLTAKKITDDLDAVVIGPFSAIPYQLDKKNGKVPEVYTLNTNKQERESLLNLFRRMR